MNSGRMLRASWHKKLFCPGARHMDDKKKETPYSRRGFLGIGGAAVGAGAILSSSHAPAQEQAVSRPGDDRKTSPPGPANPPLDTENPDSSFPPATDAGSVQTFKYPF